MRYIHPKFQARSRGFENARGGGSPRSGPLRSARPSRRRTPRPSVHRGDSPRSAPSAGQPGSPPALSAAAQKLRRQRVGIAIRHQPRQPIRFAVHQAVGRSALAFKSQRLPGSNAPVPAAGERKPRRWFCPASQLHRRAADLRAGAEGRPSQEIATDMLTTCTVSPSAGAPWTAIHRAGKDPRMPAQERLFPPGFQPDRMAIGLDDPDLPAGFGDDTHGMFDLFRLMGGSDCGAQACQAGRLPPATPPAGRKHRGAERIAVMRKAISSSPHNHRDNGGLGVDRIEASLLQPADKLLGVGAARFSTRQGSSRMTSKAALAAAAWAGGRAAEKM